MSRDEIIRMAREAQQEQLSVDGRSPSTALSGYWFSMEVADLARFATLVAAAEREACAAFLDRGVDLSGLAEHSGLQRYSADLLATLATAIRARKP